MSIRELEANEVKAYSDPSFPNWMLDAADWGQNWVLKKVYPGMRAGQPRPTVRWFSGEPTSRFKGMADGWDPDVLWLSVKMASWEEIVAVAAHETVHCIGFADEEVPTLVGRMAAKQWSREREVFVHHGSVRHDWMPEGLKELPANAVCLELDCGARTYVNRGTWRHPSWRVAIIP